MFHEAMEAAVKEHLISANPTKGAAVPKGVKKEMRVLGSEQLAAFMEQIDAEERWRDFFYTELTTGLRRGEICGLKWSDFDEESGKLHVNRSVHVRNGVVTEGGKQYFYVDGVRKPARAGGASICRSARRISYANESAPRRPNGSFPTR